MARIREEERGGKPLRVIELAWAVSPSSSLSPVECYERSSALIRPIRVICGPLITDRLAAEYVEAKHGRWLTTNRANDTNPE